MLSNTGSTETVVKYVVCRLPAITAILFHWITMKAVLQLTGLTLAGPMDRPITPVSCWTRPWHHLLTNVGCHVNWVLLMIICSLNLQLNCHWLTELLVLVHHLCGVLTTLWAVLVPTDVGLNLNCLHRHLDLRTLTRCHLSTSNYFFDEWGCINLILYCIVSCWTKAHWQLCPPVPWAQYVVVTLSRGQVGQHGHLSEDSLCDIQLQKIYCGFSIMLMQLTDWCLSNVKYFVSCFVKWTICIGFLSAVSEMVKLKM